MKSVDAWTEGRLLARPVESRRTDPWPSGTHPLGLRPTRDGLLHVPSSHPKDQPSPLLGLLHGAGGTASQMLPMAEEEAERHGVLLLAPSSEGGTWDVIRGGYGSDVEHLDRALALVFFAFDVDRERIAVGGFSDGASYALSLGIINGALFSDVLAFSPGFAAPTQAEDSPRIFMSHGTENGVLPIERCSRRLAPRLRQAGFDVDYWEFPGGHVVPEEMVEAAFLRFLRGAAVPS